MTEYFTHSRILGFQKYLFISVLCEITNITLKMCNAQIAVRRLDFLCCATSTDISTSTYLSRLTSASVVFRYSSVPP